MMTRAPPGAISRGTTYRYSEQGNRMCHGDAGHGSLTLPIADTGSIRPETSLPFALLIHPY
jgi:hypothetical protein